MELPLGWPWDQLRDLEEAKQTACRNAEHALRSGDPNRCHQAEYDLRMAAADLKAERDRLGWLFGLLFKCAAESDSPGHSVGSPVVQEFMRCFVRPEDVEHLNEQAGWVRRSVEWVLGEYRQLRSENWELALELARLKLRIERLEGAEDGVEAQDHRPSERGGARRAAAAVG